MRTTLRSTARKIQTNASRATLRKAPKNKGKWQYLEHVDVTHSETHSDIERAENYGFTSVPHDQDEEQQQQQAGQQSSSGMGTGFGGSPMEEGQQPKGDAAEVIIQYLNGSRSHPVAVVVGDRRHRVISEKGGQGQKTYAGDVYSHAGKDDVTQIMLLPKHDDRESAGLYAVTRDDRKIRVALVPKPQNQQQSQQQQANGAGGGASGSGQSTQKDYGQEPQYKKADEESTTFINMEGSNITITRGSTTVKLTGSKVFTYYQDETMSTLCDANHTHIRFKDNRIWVDETGCWSTKAIEVKQDPNDG